MDTSRDEKLQRSRELHVRNGEMEFYRFFMACMIVLYHIDVAPFGSIGVEFFFLLTGYLMASSMEHKRSMGVGSSVSNQHLWCFALHKIKSFYVELIVACAFALFAYIVLHLPFSATICPRLADFFANNLMLLRMTGITPTFDMSLMDTTWYLSSMLLAIIILYPLFYRYGYHAYILVFSLLALGYILEHGSHPLSGWEWTGVMYKANIRAFSEIAIGAFLYPVSKLLRTRHPRAPMRILLTGLKWLSVLAIVIYAFKPTFSSAVALLFLCVLLVLSFSNVCRDTHLLCNKFSLYLGKISLPLFLCHMPCMGLIKHFDRGSTIFAPLVFAVSLAVSAIISHISTWAREACRNRQQPRII